MSQHPEKLRSLGAVLAVFFVLLLSGLYAKDALQIDKAYVGAVGSWRDVTGFLRDRVRGGDLSITIEQPYTEIGGDPAYGKEKNFIVDYRFNNQPRRLWLKEEFPVAFTIKLPSPQAEAIGANLKVAAMMENISASRTPNGGSPLASRTNSAEAAVAPPDTGGDFAPVGQALTDLLQSGDAVRFAKALAPSIEDWRAWLSAHHPTNASELGENFCKSLDDQRQKLEASAKRLLALAAEGKLDFSQVRLAVSPKSPPVIGRVRYPIQEENEFLPWAQKLQFVVKVEPPAGNTKPERVRGDYTIAMRGLLRFPSGWRCNDGVQWLAFPPGVADERMQRELNIAARASDYQGLTEADDPALVKLGETLARFVQLRDLKLFDGVLLLSDTDAENKAELIGAARVVLEQMNRFDIDLAGASVQVKHATLQSLMPRSGVGEIEGVEGNQLMVTFAVRSARTSKTGTSLSGDYSLSTAEAVRKNGHWQLTGKVQWANFPEGVLDKKATAELAFENYVSEHGVLPAGSTAPDIEFVRLDDQQRMHLADLRGKVVVLDFWAVGCGSCQEPLKKMQHYSEQNPVWGDRVKLVPISIDGSLEAARLHLAKRGWTNTFNVWAGPGGAQSAGAKAFRVTSLPVSYIIGTDGVIAEANYTFSMDIPGVVNGLLK